MSPYPTARPRRLRHSARMRDWAAETDLSPGRLMLPYFVIGGLGRAEPVPALPGVERLSVDRLVAQVEADVALGLRQVMLFGVVDPAEKDPGGARAQAADGLVPGAVRALRDRLGDAVLIGADVCLCAYTSHGHCGLVDAAGEVANDASFPALARMAVALAAAGADLVAPSDMMDGRVAAIRAALDEAGLSHAAILAYAAKYASAYYGPFREAAGSSPAGGGRETYQMDPRNRREARREIALDVAEGADAILVKPALAYLDVLAAARADTHLPLACYNVSGEYAMVKAAAARGWVDEARVVRENLLAMRRAGADTILTYHARDVLRGGWL